MLRGAITADVIDDLNTIHKKAVAQKHQRVLLFVAPPGNISEALAAAVEREFTWISVQIVPDMALARDEFCAAVQLILVDMAHLDELMKCWDELVEAHPFASAAITASCRVVSTVALKRAVEKSAIRGVVPMDVNLDIWLSVIRIMLNGGEYFPPELFQRNRAVNLILPADERFDACETNEAALPVMKGLTAREREVLACVAKGLQNKLIAAKLRLSEHTVKIHIHNIIRKLGAHNRTEATALYLQCVAGEGGGSQPVSGEVSA